MSNPSYESINEYKMIRHIMSNEMIQLPYSTRLKDCFFLGHDFASLTINDSLLPGSLTSEQSMGIYVLL